MSVIVLLIIVSLALALGFLAGFVWAVKSGQYEDTWTPSVRMLTEEEAEPKEHVELNHPGTEQTKP